MDYALIANEARKKVLSMIYEAQVSHVGSNFSVIDILTVLFEKKTKDDLVILSAGWKAAAFYYFLAKKGFIKEEELDTYCKEGSRLIGLTEPNVPGVHFAGGSMGLSLPAAVGFALAKKMKGEEGTIYVIMSDGELQCGTTWESALIAAHHELDNLVVIIDHNGYCAMGKTKDILDAYFPAKDWSYSLVDGHDHGALEARFEGKFFNGEEIGPKVIFAGTTKGYPISFMSNNNTFHYKAPSIDEYKQAMVELSDEIKK